MQGSPIAAPVAPKMSSSPASSSPVVRSQKYDATAPDTESSASFEDALNSFKDPSIASATDKSQTRVSRGGGSGAKESDSIDTDPTTAKQRAAKITDQSSDDSVSSSDLKGWVQQIEQSQQANSEELEAVVAMLSKLIETQPQLRPFIQQVVDGLDLNVIQAQSVAGVEKQNGLAELIQTLREYVEPAKTQPLLTKSESVGSQSLFDKLQHLGNRAVSVIKQALAQAGGTTQVGRQQIQNPSEAKTQISSTANPALKQTVVVEELGTIQQGLKIATNEANKAIEGKPIRAQASQQTQASDPKSENLIQAQEKLKAVQAHQAKMAEIPTVEQAEKTAKSVFDANLENLKNIDGQQVKKGQGVEGTPSANQQSMRDGTGSKFGEIPPLRVNGKGASVIEQTKPTPNRLTAQLASNSFQSMTTRLTDLGKDTEHLFAKADGNSLAKADVGNLLNTRQVAETVGNNRIEAVKAVQTALQTIQETSSSRMRFSIQVPGGERVDIQMIQRDGGLQVRLATASAELRDTLARNWDSLQNAANNRGVRLMAPVVESLQQPAQQQAFQDRNSGQSSQSQNQQNAGDSNQQQRQPDHPEDRRRGQFGRPQPQNEQEHTSFDDQFSQLTGSQQG